MQGRRGEVEKTLFLKHWPGKVGKVEFILWQLGNGGNGWVGGRIHSPFPPNAMQKGEERGRKRRKRDNNALGRRGRERDLQGLTAFEGKGCQLHKEGAHYQKKREVFC